MDKCFTSVDENGGQIYFLTDYVYRFCFKRYKQDSRIVLSEVKQQIWLQHEKGCIQFLFIILVTYMPAASCFALGETVYTLKLGAHCFLSQC